MGRIIWEEADHENQEGSRSHANGFVLLFVTDPGLSREDPDTAQVAKCANEKWSQEYHHKKLQAYREQYVQLLLCEVLVTDSGVQGVIPQRKVLYDENNATVGRADNPDPYACNCSIKWLFQQSVPHREGYTQVTVHTDSHEQERACVDGGKKHKVSDWAQGIGQGPFHMRGYLMHLQWQN